MNEQPQPDQKLNRRNFLKLVGGAAGATVLGAIATTGAEATPSQGPQHEDTKTEVDAQEVIAKQTMRINEARFHYDTAHRLDPFLRDIVTAQCDQKMMLAAGREGATETSCRSSRTNQQYTLRSSDNPDGKTMTFAVGINTLGIQTDAFSIPVEAAYDKTKFMQGLGNPQIGIYPLDLVMSDQSDKDKLKTVTCDFIVIPKNDGALKMFIISADPKTGRKMSYDISERPASYLRSLLTQEPQANHLASESANQEVDNKPDSRAKIVRRDSNQEDADFKAPDIGWKAISSDLPENLIQTVGAVLHNGESKLLVYDEKTGGLSIKSTTALEVQG